MAIKEVIQERVRQAMQEYKENFINEQKGEYEKAVIEYEALLTEYYKLEFRLEFLKALDRLRPASERNGNLEELKQQQIVFMKKIKDIENSGALEGYDAVIEAIDIIGRN